MLKKVSSNPEDFILKPFSSPCEENFTEGSPHPTCKNSEPKLQKLFEDLLEEDFHEESKDDEDKQGSSLALYTFTNEQGLRNSQEKPKFNLGLNKVHKQNLAASVGSPRFVLDKQFVEKYSKSDQLQSRNRAKVQLSEQVEIQELRKTVEKQKKIIAKNEEKCKKIVEEYEKRIEDLELQNFELMKKLGSFRRNGKRNGSNLQPNGHRKLMSVDVGGEKNEIVFKNGTRSEVYPNGYRVLYYPNGDIKQEHPDGMSIYFFANEQTTKTTFKNGIQLIKFNSGQTEKIFPDGTQEIKFPDGTLRCIFPSGESQTVYPDKTIEKQDKDGTKSIIHLRHQV